MIRAEKVDLDRVKNEVIHNYGNLIVTAHTFFMVINPQGDFLYINPSAEKLLGYSNGELFKKSIFTVTKLKDRDTFNKRIMELLDKRKSVCRWDDIKVCKNGELFRVKNEASLFNLLDQPTVLVHFMISHAERSIVNESHPNSIGEIPPTKAQQIAEAFRVIETSPFEIFTKKDLNGVYTYVSPSVRTILGYEPNEMIKAPYLKYIHPDDHALVKNFHSLDWNSKDFSLIVYRIRHINGTYKWFESSVNLNIGTGKSTINRPEYIEICRDISERKRYELGLAESREQYRRLVNHSLDTIAIIVDGKWAFMNDSGLKMFEVENRRGILGRSIYDFLHPNYHHIYKERTKNILQENKIAPRLEQEWYTINKKMIYTEVVRVPTQYRDKHAVMIIIRDITDRKRAEEMIINSEKLTIAGQLAASIAHEIRNPLTSLKGFLQLINQSSTEVKSHYYDIMGSELNRIELILNELLMLAKPQPTAFRQIDLIHLIDSVVALLVTHANMNKIEIITQYEKNILPMHCDENQIKQVFINLIKNAIEAMPLGGQVTVKVGLAHHEVTIELEDQGCGIPEDQLEKLGQPFFTTKEKGTGLGLMVSYQMIENHGGRISVSSTVNEGTSFKVFLPLSRDA